MNRNSPVLISAFLLLLTMNTQAQLVIAHRGASAEAPENTLAAFKLAWELGADGIEGDFFLSQDGEIVCIHDGTTKRVAAGKVDLPVAGTTFAELRQLDVGSWKSPKYVGEQIPTLAEVLGTVPPGKHIFIEIKCGPEIVPALKRQLEKFPQLKPDQIAIISFNEDVITACRSQLPQLTANWLVGYKQNKATGEWQPAARSILASLARNGASGLGTQAQLEVITPEFIEQLRDAKLGFHCWTVDDAPTAAQFQSLGVDSITTNVPDFIRASITLHAGDETR